MKKIISLTLALIMAATIFIVPGGAAVYADDSMMPVTENTTDNTQSEGEGEQITEEETRDISGAAVTFGYTSYFYTGKARTPDLTVIFEDKLLVRDVDYTVTYSNNIYPGKATATVSGINGYQGSIEAEFEIARVSKLKATAIGSDYIKLAWGSQKNVTGYKVYSYSSAKGKWVLKKSVEAPNTSCTVEGLKAGYNYMFRVQSYVGNNYSSPSTTLYVPTKPERVVLSSFITTPKLTATVKWKEKKSTGYQVLVARNSKFESATKYTLKSNDTLYKKLTDLEKDKYYYVKVRAYKTYKNKTSYGIWSKYKKVKATDTGWITIDGKKYY